MSSLSYFPSSAVLRAVVFGLAAFVLPAGPVSPAAAGSLLPPAESPAGAPVQNVSVRTSADRTTAHPQLQDQKSYAQAREARSAALRAAAAKPRDHRLNDDLAAFSRAF